MIIIVIIIIVMIFIIYPPPCYWSGPRLLAHLRSISGKSAERHAAGARPPRRQTYISVVFGLLSQSRSQCFPL